MFIVVIFMVLFRSSILFSHFPDALALCPFFPPFFWIIWIFSNTLFKFSVSFLSISLIYYVFNS